MALLCEMQQHHKAATTRYIIRVTDDPSAAALYTHSCLVHTLHRRRIVRATESSSVHTIQSEIPSDGMITVRLLSEASDWLAVPMECKCMQMSPAKQGLGLDLSLRSYSCPQSIYSVLEEAITSNYRHLVTGHPKSPQDASLDTRLYRKLF